MDTWATSSLSPQIGGRKLSDSALYSQVFPMSLRAQAHEIIRTWAFYTIVQSEYDSGTVPWKEILVSGWGLAPEGTQKISKSRGGGPMAPMEMIERHSADATRFWAASTGPGKDSIISEEKIKAGAKPVTKFWNVATLSRRFLNGYRPSAVRPPLSPADRWLLSRVQSVVQDATTFFERYEYAAAKTETETFFWHDFSDNYLEMAKKRLYDADDGGHDAARFTLYSTLLTVVKLFAPFLPYVTEEIYGTVFRPVEGQVSVHRSPWPEVDKGAIDGSAEAAGEVLIEIATAVRRYKSDNNLSLGSPLKSLHIHVHEEDIARILGGAEGDIASVTRAELVTIGERHDDGMELLPVESRRHGGLDVYLCR
ncbi:MAG: hypothetical protein NVSMB52_00300 [Chloroflexota bacterium]